jgi:hypothetical protein
VRVGVHQEAQTTDAGATLVHLQRLLQRARWFLEAGAVERRRLVAHHALLRTYARRQAERVLLLAASAADDLTHAAAGLADEAAADLACLEAEHRAQRARRRFRRQQAAARRASCEDPSRAYFSSEEEEEEDDDDGRAGGDGVADDTASVVLALSPDVAGDGVGGTHTLEALLESEPLLRACERILMGAATVLAAHLGSGSAGPPPTPLGASSSAPASPMDIEARASPPGSSCSSSSSSWASTPLCASQPSADVDAPLARRLHDLAQRLAPLATAACARLAAKRRRHAAHEVSGMALRLAEDQTRPVCSHCRRRRYRSCPSPPATCTQSSS